MKALRLFFLLILPCASHAAVVEEVSGWVHVKERGSKRWSPASVGIEFKPGSNIRTRRASSARIEFEDGSTVALFSGTLLGLEKSAPESLVIATSSGSTEFALKGSFTVLTPQGEVSGTTGARFRLDFSDDGVLVRMREGEAGLLPRGGPASVLAAGQSAALAETKPPATAGKAARSAARPASGRSIGRSAIAAGGDFGRVLARPDDPETNFSYVRSRVEEGDLRAAMVGLERILMVDPENHGVRVYYAEVLLKLELLDDVQFQLEVLRPQELDAAARVKVSWLEEELERRRRKFKLAARLTTAFDYNTNRNAAPSGGQRLVFGTPVDLTGEGTRRGDTAFVGSGEVSASREIGRRKHQVFGSASYLRTEQSEVDTLDLQAFSARYGATLKTRRLDISPLGLFDHVRLHGETFLKVYGGGLRLRRQFNESFGAYLESRAAYHDYNRTTDIGAGPERTGRRYDETLGLDLALRKDLLLAATYTWSRQEAVRLYNAYATHSGSLSALWALKKGLFLVSSLSYAVIDYDQNDPLINAVIRGDETFRARVTLGIPLSAISISLRDFLFTQSYEFFISESNIKNFSYSDNKVSTALTYKWEL